MAHPTPTSTISVPRLYGDPYVPVEEKNSLGLSVLLFKCTSKNTPPSHHPTCLIAPPRHNNNNDNTLLTTNVFMQNYDKNKHYKTTRR